jgi:zinc protease
MAAVIDNMVQKRLAILEESTSPFSSARSRFVNPYEATGPRFDAFEEYFEIKRNRTQEAVKVALTEIERINRYGFTQEELTSSIAQLSKKIHDASPSLLDIGRRYIAHFVHGEIYPGLQEETLLQQKILADIRLDQINQLAKNIFGENSCDILILAPEQSDVMTEDEMRQLQMGVRNIDLQPYKIPKSDLFSNSDSLIHNIQLLSKPVAPGDWIITKKNIAAIGITELTLSNGSLILLKPLKNKEEKNGIITIHAFKKGGYSAYKTVDQLSAMVAPIAVIRSGIVGLNRTDLKELDNKYGFKVNVYMDKSEEHIIATCRAEHFELLLKLIYLYLKYPKLDLETFNETARSFKEMPNDTVTLSEGLYNKLNAVWNTRIDVPKGYKADLQTGLNIYKDHFSNVSGFNFVIVGNFDTTYAIPLLNRYIGSLDGKVQPINETLQKHSSNNKSKLNTRKIVYTEKGKRLAQINMCFGSSCELNLKNNLILNLLSSTLKDVLLNRIRDKEGATYALTTFIRTKGNQDLTIEIVFDCAPEVAELMADYVLQEIDKLKNNELNTQALAKMKILETERLNRELTTSSFWEEYIKHQKRYNYPLNEIENARWVISKITSKELQAAAVKYLSIDRHFELINLPK